MTYKTAEATFKVSNQTTCNHEANSTRLITQYLHANFQHPLLDYDPSPKLFCIESDLEAFGLKLNNSNSKTF